MTTRLETFAKLPGIGRVVIRCIDWLGRIRGKHLCEESGCIRYGDRYECDDWHTYACWEHADKAGFCRGCGGFWAGVDSFDFSRSGLCDNCDYEFRADTGEFDEDEEIYAP